MVWPITRADVESYAGQPVTAANQPALDRAVAAAVRFVERLHDDGDETTVAYAPTADDELGAIMLAWRWYSRRATPGGVVNGEFGPAYVVRTDPDVALLLGLGSPRVG